MSFARWIRYRALAAAVCLAVLGATLGIALPAAAQPPAPQMRAMGEFISIMSSYLELSERWVGMVGDPDTTVFLAIEGITEVYEQMGRKADAIPHLRRIAETHDGSRAVTNAVHFKIRDIYKDLGQPEKALAELDAIVAENAR